MIPKTEIENCFPGKSPSPCACLRVAASAKAGEGAGGRGNLKGELFTLTPAYRPRSRPRAGQAG
ncbi:MAG: hypothetical protein ABII96_12010 [Candidatus Zixiibacteriota bacterium]